MSFRVASAPQRLTVTNLSVRVSAPWSAHVHPPTPRGTHPQAQIADPISARSPTPGVVTAVCATTMKCHEPVNCGAPIAIAPRRRSVHFFPQHKRKSHWSLVSPRLAQTPRAPQLPDARAGLAARAVLLSLRIGPLDLTGCHRWSLQFSPHPTVAVTDPLGAVEPMMTVPALFRIDTGRRSDSHACASLPNGVHPYARTHIAAHRHVPG